MRVRYLPPPGLKSGGGGSAPALPGVEFAAGPPSFVGTAWATGGVFCSSGLLQAASTKQSVVSAKNAKHLRNMITSEWDRQADMFGGLSEQETAAKDKGIS